MNAALKGHAAMNDNHLQEHLSQHPDGRLPLAALGLFQGYVAIPVLRTLMVHAGLPGLSPAQTAEDWAACLAQAADAGVLPRGARGYQIPSSLEPSLHALLSGVFSNSLPALEQAFVRAYASHARRLLQKHAAEPEPLRAVLQPEEANFLHALRLARTHSQWTEVPDLLRALQHLQAARPAKDWDALISELEEAVRSIRDTRRLGLLSEVLLQYRAELLRQGGDERGNGRPTGGCRISTRSGGIRPAWPPRSAGWASWRRNRIKSSKPRNIIGAASTCIAGSAIRARKASCSAGSAAWPGVRAGSNPRPPG